MRLTNKHLRQAGARLVRTGGYADEQIRTTYVRLTPRQIEQLLIGARAERAKPRPEPRGRLFRGR